jgi:hypothetical protein
LADGNAVAEGKDNSCGNTHHGRYEHS